MKKLQVNKGNGWEWVFCRNKSLRDSCVTTPRKNQALPRGPWGKDDLEWARKTWAQYSFRLASSLTE